MDTSALVEAFVPGTTSAREFETLVTRGELPSVSAIALFEWLRGPRSRAELSIRMLLMPDDTIAAFGHVEAEVAARLYRRVRRPRGREADLAIAACAIVHGARLWTLNPRDFRDIPGLTLHGGARHQKLKKKNRSMPVRSMRRKGERNTTDCASE